MKKILVIQSREKLESLATEQEGFRRAVEGKGECTFISTLDDSLLWETPQELLYKYDAVIIGGSGDFDFDGGRSKDDPARLRAYAIRDRLTALVSYCLVNKIPLLGICFGHQIMSEVHKTPVHSDPLQKKVGSHMVRLTPEGKRDILFKDFPEAFVAQYGHKDSLSALPTDATLLAVGDDCRYSALQYGPKAYSVQFHPELTAQDVLMRLKNSPGYLPEGVVPESLVKESREASMLISAFIERIVTVG